MSSFVTAGTQISESDLLAQNAQETANNNATGIKNINDPNYLSPFEKPQLQVQMDNFATIYAADKDIATPEGIDFTSYDAAYQAYLAYMKPLTADISTYSPIVRTTFNSLVVAVQNAQKAFNAATKAKYDQDMDKAKADIANNQSSYAAMQQAVADVKSNANSVADTASRAISSAGFASNAASTASQAANEASQAASSALASATSAQSDASSAVTQASAAAADSKDAKQIAGAVNQSYKILTDGSTMTIAELEGGLAAKLTKTDLDGYSTQTWTQNQIKITADGINGTMSSIKGTVDEQTTSINDLKADSSGFKDQFTKVSNTLGKQTTDIGTLQTDSSGFKAQFQTVNDTLGKHTTDIGTLQTSSKELSSNFNSLDSDNKTNQHDISELKQTAKDFSSTISKVDNLASKNPSNIIKDGGFNSSVAGQVPSGWDFSGTAQIVANPDKVSSLVTTGHPVLQINSKTSGNSDIYYGDWFDVQPGDQFYAELKARWSSMSQKGQIVLGMITKNATGSPIWTGAVTIGSPSNWAKYTGLLTIPAGAVQGRVWVSWRGSAATNEAVQVTDLVVRPAYATTTELTHIKQTADGAQVLATNNQGDIAKLQVTAKGLQTTVNDKVSSDQLTQLSGQLTNQIKDLSSSTSSQFTQTANDINGLVKKGDVVNQFNLDAGGALLSTSGDSTKIVFSAPNIIFDTANPVQIPNANIPGVLTNKTFEAGTITATTKIRGADIEAPLIHSPSGSFKLDGNTGDIIGASIHSADNSWGIDKDGNISGVDIKIGGTYSHVSTGSGQVITGAIYNELDSAGYHQWTDDNDHVRINNGVITITNNADEKANANIEGIPLGVFISEGNAQFTGSLKIGNIYTNGAHTINSIDGGGIYFEGGTDTGNSMVDIYTGNIHADGTIQTGNIMIGNSHSITMQDGAKAGTMYFSDSSGSQSYTLKAKSFSQSSLLSLKTDITEIDPHEALVELVKNDFMSYHYKNDKSNDPKTVSVILDDINPIPKYYTSDIFKSADGTGRNDGNVVGYLGLSVKDLNSREIADKAKIAELETRLQKLEGAN